MLLHRYFSLGKTSGRTTKAAGNVRSPCISQEIQVGFEQIHCSWKCERKSMSVSSNDNGLFEETNEQRIFSKVFYNWLRFKFHVDDLQSKILQWKISYGKCRIITKPKVKTLWFCACDKLHTQNYLRVCLRVACDRMRLGEQCGRFDV